MAGVRVVGNTGDIAFSTSTKTIAQIVAASNHRVRLERVRISFKGTSSAEAPVLVQLSIQTTAGTMSSLTLVKADATYDETLQTTAQHTATVEPTTTNVLASSLVHPQGSYDFVFPPGRDFLIPGGTRLGILVNTPTQAGTANVSFEIEE